MKTALLTVALMAVAGVAHAQGQNIQTIPDQTHTPAYGGTSNPATALPSTAPNATASEAATKAQLEARGYSGVKSLVRNPDGSWNAKAMRDNVEVAVVIDTAGNIAEQ
jgi:hypothetical protein